MKENQTNRLAFILICFVFLMFIEATIFGNGSIVLVLLGIGMMYFSTTKTYSIFILDWFYSFDHRNFFYVEFATFTTCYYGLYPV